MKELFLLLINQPQEAFQRLPRHTWLVLMICGFLLLFIWQSGDSESEGQRIAQENQGGIQVPKGLTLVPITIENYESLDSFLGPYGVVDLYRVTEESRRSPQLVAERIKIVRSEPDSSGFAVLVPEAQASALFDGGMHFYVAIQNITQSGTKIVKANRGKKKNKLPRRQIVIFEQEVN